MSRSTVHARGHGVCAPELTTVRTGVPIAPDDKNAYGDAANDAVASSAAQSHSSDRLEQVFGPNLNISAWYAINGTAMA